MGNKHIALLEWLKTATEEQVIETGTSRGYLRQIAYRNKKASAELASRIEKATNGEVSRKQLRPEDWSVIWPELAAA